MSGLDRAGSNGGGRGEVEAKRGLLTVWRRQRGERGLVFFEFVRLGERERTQQGFNGLQRKLVRAGPHEVTGRTPLFDFFSGTLGLIRFPIDAARAVPHWSGSDHFMHLKICCSRVGFCCQSPQCGTGRAPPVRVGLVYSL